MGTAVPEDFDNLNLVARPGGQGRFDLRPGRPAVGVFLGRDIENPRQ